MENVKVAEQNLNDIIIGTLAEYTVTFPYDITGYTFEVKIKNDLEENEFSQSIDLVNKKLTFYFSNTDTASITKNVYDWYLVQIDGSGDKTRLIVGQVEVKEKNE